MATYKFHDDLDIRNVYKHILSLLEDTLRIKDTYKQEYDICKTIMARSHNPVDRAKAAKIVSKYDSLLPSVLSGTLMDDYKKKVSPILDTYVSLSPTSRVFGMDTCPCIPKRVATIMEFLRVSSTYTDISWECTYNMSKVCPSCYSSMRKAGQVLICDTCKHVQTVPIIPHYVIPGGRVKTESSYKARKNYDKEYKRVCGIIHSATPDQQADIESYLYRSGIHDPSREDVRNAIKMCSYNNYNDTNYLYGQITGNPLPPIEQYVDITGERFDMYHDIFRNIAKEGKNITNLHFLIRLFLWQEDIPYEEEWFSSLSEKTVEKHRRNASKICEVLQKEHPSMNWKYYWDT